MIDVVPGPEKSLLSIADIVSTIKRRKRMIVIVTGSVTLLGIMYAVLAQPRYTATVVVQPVDMDSGGMLSSLASKFGGAAALAGIDLNGGGSNQQEYLAILRSRELEQRFIKMNNLLPQLFPKRWDDSKGTWIDSTNSVLPSIARAISGGLAYISRDRGWRPKGVVPTDGEASDVFDDMLTVTEDTASGTVSVGMEFRNPALAQRWATAYVALANEDIRGRAIRDATNAYAYLNKKAEETTATGVLDSIFRLMETQLETLALANVRQEYAFMTVDAAQFPEERSHPNRPLVVLLALFLGFFAAAFWALLSDHMKSAAGSDVVE